MAGTSIFNPQNIGMETTNQVAVVSSQYCAPYPVDLSVVRKVMAWMKGAFGVTDGNGNIIFKVQTKLSLRDSRILLDAAGNTLLTFVEKVWSAHSRWLVYRGESRDDKDLLFSVKKSKPLQFKTKLEVILANNNNNTKEEVCDFKIEGSWLERTCTIYAGHSTNIVAQMHKKFTAQSVLLGKENFGVTVYPNVDQAFIVALIVILEEINEDR